MTIFDRNPLTALSKDTRAIWYYYAKTGDLREPANYSEEVAEQMLDRTGMPLGIEKRPPIYDDQVLPFDITITAQNEYGNAAVKRIYGVEILNSGAGISVDDIVNESQATFVARSLSNWIPIDARGANSPNAYVWNREFERLTSTAHAGVSQ